MHYISLPEHFVWGRDYRHLYHQSHTLFPLLLLFSLHQQIFIYNGNWGRSPIIFSCSFQILFFLEIEILGLVGAYGNKSIRNQTPLPKQSPVLIICLYWNRKQGDNYRQWRFHFESRREQNGFMLEIFC